MVAWLSSDVAGPAEVVSTADDLGYACTFAYVAEDSQVARPS
ncbi:hypothetical protein [Nonomuraea roseola]|uniref:Uncharacterized protein n=1 Tax=Nonomuraea roseola TaxID=46179 RepID=A0ABV5Q434_9ACTN